MYGVNGPAGFIPVRSFSSSNPFNDGLETFPLLTAGGFGCYRGDIIRAEATGFVQQLSSSQQGSAVAFLPVGVAQSFSWLGVNNEDYFKKPGFVPGTSIAAGTNVTCFAITDPFTVYTVQADTVLGIEQTSMWNNFAFNAATTYTVGGQTFPLGDPRTNISTVRLAKATGVTTAANTVARIIGVTAHPGNNWYIPGTNTIGYNNVNVVLNNNFFLQSVGV